MLYTILIQCYIRCSNLLLFINNTYYPLLFLINTSLIRTNTSLIRTLFINWQKKVNWLALASTDWLSRQLISSRVRFIKREPLHQTRAPSSNESPFIKREPLHQTRAPSSNKSPFIKREPFHQTRAPSCEGGRGGEGFLYTSLFNSCLFFSHSHSHSLSFHLKSIYELIGSHVLCSGHL